MIVDWIAAFVCVNVHLPVSAPDRQGYDKVYVNPFGDAAVNSAPITVLNDDNRYEPIGTVTVIVVLFSFNWNIFSRGPFWIK